MKILILGSFGKGALENFYVNGLIAMELQPEKFDITEQYYRDISTSLYNKVRNKVNPAWFFKPINDRLLKFIHTKRYDVILIFKGLTLFPGTIEELKRHTSILCCYNPDHPYEFYSEGSGNANIRESIKHYDLYFSYSKSISNGLRIKFGSNSFVIPFGFDDARKPSIKYTGKFDNSWLFIGAYDNERFQFFQMLSEPGVKIYGEDKWASRNKRSVVAREYYQGHAIYDADYQKAIAASAGVFNILRKQNLKEGSHNMRTFEVPGYNGLMISNRTPEQEEYFTADKEAVYFDSIPELKDKLRYLSLHPDEIDKIKAAAIHRAQTSGYSYFNRTKQLLAIVRNELSS